MLENSNPRVSFEQKWKAARQLLRKILKDDDSKAYVYFVQLRTGGLIKVGSSAAPLKRLIALQGVLNTGFFVLDVSGDPTLEIIAINGYDSVQEAEIAEAHLHNEFAGHHVHGEWYGEDRYRRITKHITLTADYINPVWQV